MKLGRSALIAAIVLVTASYIALSVWMSDVSRRQGVSSHSDTGRGLSLFRELVGERGRSLARAFLHADVLAGIDTLIIASPRIPLSPLEAKTIETYVKNGGRLVLSFHDEQTYGNVASMIDAVAPKLKAEVNELFRNDVVVRISGDEGDELFPAGAVDDFYHMYGRMHFCAQDVASCSVHHVTLGDGEAWIIASLPPFANALVGRGANHDVAARLAAMPGTIGFDEYHQLFSDKTKMNLATEPRIALPLFGMLVIVILQLAFGRAPLPMRARSVVVTPSYHELGVQLVEARLGTERGKAEALRRLQLLGARRFPANDGETSRAKDAAAFLALHKEQLLRLRRRVDS